MTTPLKAALAIALSFLSLGALACQDFELMSNTLTITCPGVNIEDQMMEGAVVGGVGANAKPAANLSYQDNRNAFEGVPVYLCLNGNGWTCGSGSLRRILGPNDRPFAQGVFRGGKAVIQLPMVMSEAQLANLTGVVRFHNGVNGWLQPLR